MKATIYDVAKEAGVSIATVSKVINRTGKISEATRVKVLETMKGLNYYPSVVASALTGKRTETLGLLVPDISNPFFSEIARTIEDRAHDRGMSVIMCSTDDNAEKEKKYIELLQRKQVDGLIVASGFQDKKLLDDLKRNNIPLVMLSLDDPSLDVTTVSVDDYKGGFEAASHLLSLGHRNIAIIGEEVHSSRMRILGFRDAFEVYGEQFDERNLLRTTASLSNGSESVKKFLQQDNPPTAVFACNDLIAIGAIQGARELAVSVPDDLSIIGFDNTILATTTVPALTTVAQPMGDMGNKVVDILIEEIHRSVVTRERILFKPKLIVRGTTKEK
ncbi:LacI family DNA-binding transcriptional regulator [Guptibacillus hwajinpoensis]|uniref:LacI family DNA-binding transcriptional regulator n=1 Tax=Guptibacillus hwajinpoensis TaxID=208199 RepID=UPI003734D573